jgi:hypothetical protein
MLNDQKEKLDKMKAMKESGEEIPSVQTMQERQVSAIAGGVGFNNPYRNTPSSDSTTGKT